MIEILILFKMAGNIGRIVAAKGHPKFFYQFLLVALWFGGELAGGIFGYVLGMALADGEEPSLGFPYLFALGTAVVGAVVAFAIAKRLPDRKAEEAFYPGAEYDRRWRDEGRPAGEADRPRADEGAYTDRPEARPRPDDRIRE
jgi:hypothetical protein